MITLLLAGVVVNAFFSALVMFILSVTSISHLPSAIFWMMGDLSAKNYSTLAAVSLYYLPGIALLLGLSRDFNLMALGEESAEQLGVNIERTKLLTFISASLITAVAVSVSGLIGFVGLMVPHIIRLIFGPDHRLLISASFLFGATFLVLCDLIARTVISPAELPVGVITAILGGQAEAVLAEPGEIIRREPIRQGGQRVQNDDEARAACPRVAREGVERFVALP